MSDRKRCLTRSTSLERERASWLSHWRDINNVLMPRSGQFFVTDANRGNRRNQDILDNTPQRALTTLAAGMQSGLTSPARPWLKLETQNPEMMEVAAVSQWLDHCTTTMLNVFQRSNTYKALHHLYREIGAYATGASVVLPDFDTVIHHRPQTVGSFCIATNHKGVVDTFQRRLQMTVGQIVKDFVVQPDGTLDWSSVTPTIKNLWDSHDQDAWVPVTQLIEPRPYEKRLNGSALPKDMPFANYVWEDGQIGDKLLRDGGYRRFPVLVPRWLVNGEDIYGSDCPGMVALGDMEALQSEQMQKARAIDYQVNPPLQVPIELQNSGNADLLPGGVSFVSQAGPQNGIRTAFDVNLNLQHLVADIGDGRQRINAAFYADIFLFLSSLEGQRGQKTAREIAEIHEEKLLMLGPVVEGLQNDLLTPLVDITFDACMEAGMFPPPPPELQNERGETPLKVEYTSILAQAQRSVATTGVDRLIGLAGGIAQATGSPNVWDKFDLDKVIDKAAGYIGTDPEIIRGEDQVAEIRANRQQQQAAMQKAALAQQAAETAKTASETDLSGDSALTAIMNR